MATAQSQASRSVSDNVKKIVRAHKKDPGDLIGILQDIQAKYRYLPREALQEVCKSLDIPMNRMYRVSTFFRAFYLEPRGKHECVVCTGTACHVRGAQRIVDELSRELKTEPGSTSSDKLFSLDTVNCLGACALGPVMTIDGANHGKLTARSARSIINRYKKKESGGTRKNEAKKSSRSGKSKAKGTRKARSK